MVSRAAGHGRRRARGGRIRRLARRMLIAALALAMLVALPTWAGSSQIQPSEVTACSPEQRSIRFYDVAPAGAHAETIDCLAFWGVSLGMSGHHFAPREEVLRGHLASFLLRTLQTAGLRFHEQAELVDAAAAGIHAAPAAKLVAAGILDAEDGSFRPDAPVRRDTMAVSLVAAYERALDVTVPTPRGRPFLDLTGHPDADVIAKAVALGLVRGTTDATYEPAGTVTRAQMATFLTRLLDELVGAELAAPPAAPDWGLETELAVTLSEAAAQGAVPADLSPPLDVADQTLARVYDEGCVTETTTSPACVYGDTTAERTVITYGDSHMAHWFPAIEEVATEHGWRLVVLTKGGCPAWEVQVRSDDGRTDTCPIWRSQAVQRIAAEQPEMVVISGATHYEAYDEHGRPASDRRTQNLLAGQAAATERVAQAAPDARLVVFGASGRARFDAVDCLSEHTDALEHCMPARAEVVDDGLIAEQQRLASAAGATFADPSRWLCTDAVCPPIIDGRLVRWDAHHLSPGLTGWLAPMIEPILFGAPG